MRASRGDHDPATHLVEAEVWRHAGKGGWHFVTMPPDVADDIRARTATSARPFGTVATRVTLGSSTWETSLFADTRSGSYLLPLKAAVLTLERVGDGDVVALELELRDA